MKSCLVYHSDRKKTRVNQNMFQIINPITSLIINSSKYKNDRCASACVKYRARNGKWKSKNPTFIYYKNKHWKYSCHQKIARTAQSFFLLPACIRLMNPPSPLCAVYFSTEKYKYDPSRKQTEVSASQTSQQGSLLLIAERKSQPGRSAHAALDAEEGGKERRRQGGGKWKRGFFFFFLRLWQKLFTDGWDRTDGGQAASVEDWAGCSRRRGSLCGDFDLRSPKTPEVFTFLIHVNLNICTTPTWKETRIPTVLLVKSLDIHSVILIWSVLQLRRTRKITMDLHAFG